MESILGGQMGISESPLDWKRNSRADWGGSIWLGTIDDCYVDQYDLVSYNGSCEFTPRGFFLGRYGLLIYLSRPARPCVLRGRFGRRVLHHARRDNLVRHRMQHQSRHSLRYHKISSSRRGSHNNLLDKWRADH
jgi:hypothetical protein